MLCLICFNVLSTDTKSSVFARLGAGSPGTAATEIASTAGNTPSNAMSATDVKQVSSVYNYLYFILAERYIACVWLKRPQKYNLKREQILKDNIVIKRTKRTLKFKMRLIRIDSRAGQSEDCQHPWPLTTINCAVMCKPRNKTVGQHFFVQCLK